MRELGKIIKALPAILMLSFAGIVAAQEFNTVPVAWKWLDNDRVAFTYDGSYSDSSAFAVRASTRKKTGSIYALEKYPDFPVHPEGAVNLTWSPDSTMLAFTRDNDLYVHDLASGNERRLTSDGSEVILNGYASWVYYEEIFGRPSRYRAFWWSPDSKKIAFFRFDNTDVPVFPIYSPFGQDGTLKCTRYPKAGEPNPKVRIGIIDLADGIHGSDARDSADNSAAETPAIGDIVWADFDENDDQYFGTPFWGADSQEFFVSREPRVQNTLDLYSVSVKDGGKRHIYHEAYDTWVDWIDGMLFAESGLYMARSFETGWEQIYFLPYDGSGVRRLTEGTNWRISLLRSDEESGKVYFTACRDASVRQCLYQVDRSGEIKALTDTSLNVTGVRFSPDGKHFVASLSNFTTPTQIWLCETASAAEAWKAHRLLAAERDAVTSSRTRSGKTSYIPRRYGSRPAGTLYKVADMAGPDWNPSAYALPELIWIENDGFRLPGYIVYPHDFDPSGKYPVHVDIYGGPDTPMVRDRWIRPSENNQWWPENGIIEVTVDCRAAGHSGRKGLDQIYKHLNTVEIQDFIAWAKYLQSLPYVNPDKIGVEGFSFGGTMTAMLLLTASDYFHYGIAGGGVYDWQLYDTHYTERFMETPQSNPDGYAGSRVISHVASYPVSYPSFSAAASGPESSPSGHQPASDTETPDIAPVMLKLTHGTGDDNVHFQNTLQLIDEMQKQGKCFELMIYPDGMHGYCGYQGEHSDASDHAFWLKYLCGE